MRDEILTNFSYGIFAIGVKDDEKVSACIANTVIQISNSPNMLAVSISKNNYSHSCIEKTGYFTVSVLSEDTSGAVIGALGFNSGKNIEKLKHVSHKILAEGLPVIRENSCCWFLCKVVGRADASAHTVFLAEVVAGSDTSKGTPMTYFYYRNVIKGSAPNNAPTFLERPSVSDNHDGERFICTICSYVYENSDVAFEELAEDWVCPICGAPKSAFKRKL